ncbi:DUF1304 domain-containing protein [Actinocrispum sp. NPDC049592]|uniref:DUF1304 domain-containing protein n=1 Tax=Actinocrispum sp. NPDC049592 TaxID=3154835 RepID=UPI00342D632B
MSVIAQVFAWIAIAIHVGVWVLESFLFQRSWVHQGFFKIAAKDVPGVLLWSVNQGFYNLMLAGGMVFGVIAMRNGDTAVGGPFITYTCVFMAVCGVVLGVSDWLGLGRPKGSSWGGAIGQALPPILVLLTF